MFGLNLLPAKRLSIFFCSSMFFLSSDIYAQKPLTIKLDSVSTSPPRQQVKEVTASPYIFEFQNDFDRDGELETVVGARCVKGWCENYIFKHLNNKRYRFLGMAHFNQKSYELVWEAGASMPDIIYFKRENVGQGCLGRLKYGETLYAYEQEQEVCRLPLSVRDSLNSYRPVAKVKPKPKFRSSDPDYIDFSDIKFNDRESDLYPE